MIGGLLNRGQSLSVPAVLAGLAIVFVSLRARAPAGWVVGAGSDNRRKRYDDEDDDFDDEDGNPDPHEPPNTPSRA